MAKIMKFEEILDGLFDFYKNTIAKKKDKKYKYKGPDVTCNEILCVSPSIKEQLSKKEFEYRVEYKGNHPIELLLTAAIQLGIQQGINMCSKNPKKYLEKKSK